MSEFLINICIFFQPFDSVQNFCTHSSEALSAFYKCFVIPLWWRRDTFTEDYSARDINHHLKNKAAICLEGFLESAKAKFNKKSHGSHSKRTDLLSRRLKPCARELCHGLGTGVLRSGVGRPFAHFKEDRRCLQRPSWTFQGYLLKIETSPLGSDFDIDLLWMSQCPTAISTIVTAKSLWSLPSTQHKAVNKTDTSEMVRGSNSCRRNSKASRIQKRTAIGSGKHWDGVQGGSGDWGTVRWQEGMDLGHWGRDFLWRQSQCDLGWLPLSFSCVNIIVAGFLVLPQIPDSSTLAHQFNKFCSVNSKLLVSTYSSVSSAKAAQVSS